MTLDDCKLFRELSSPELDSLRAISIEKKYPAGGEIFREGSNGDGLYLLKQGSVEISTTVAADRRSVLSQVEPGDIFGEMAVFETKPRSANAIAVKDSIVLFFPRDPLLAIIEKSPSLSMTLLREISRRLRDFNQRHIQEVLQAERLAVIGRFSRSIVHDLKNPLNIIGLTADMAAMENAPPATRQKAAATIRKQIERISEMVGDILDFTRGTRAEAVLGTTEYAGFVQQVIEEIRPEVELRDSRLEIQTPIPSIQLPLDPKRLRRVFVNLIHNATDAMPTGGTVFVRFKNSGNELITEIADTGHGIAPEIADKLFQVFATFGKEHGTGLGLSICKKIIEDHRGRIWARNERGSGAVFSFALPTAQ
jgi:signal transduction histidine kinase